MLSLSLYCGPENASRQKAKHSHRAHLTCFPSQRGQKTALPAVWYLKRVVIQTLLGCSGFSSRRTSPVIPSSMEVEATDAMKWPSAVPPSHPTPKPFLVVFNTQDVISFDGFLWTQNIVGSPSTRVGMKKHRVLSQQRFSAPFPHCEQCHPNALPKPLF